MTLFTMVSIGLLVYGAMQLRPQTTRVLAGVVSVVALLNPFAGGGMGLAWYSLRRRRVLRERRLSGEEAEGEIELLTHSLLIGLSGGLSPAAALKASREMLGSGLGTEVDTILRRSVRQGLASSLLNATGVGGRLFRQVGAAHLSGAPLSLALTALATEHRAAARAKAMEAARRLSVKMMVPITLLMLPGLLILMVGPLVLPAVARLLGPVMSI